MNEPFVSPRNAHVLTWCAAVLMMIAARKSGWTLAFFGSWGVAAWVLSWHWTYVIERVWKRGLDV